jgi:hypothetical protein
MKMVPGHSTRYSQTDSGGAGNLDITVIWGWPTNKVNNLDTNQHIAVKGLKPGSGFDTAEPEPDYPESCRY